MLISECQALKLICAYVGLFLFQKFQAYALYLSLNRSGQPFGHTGYAATMQVEFGLPHHGMDRTAPIEDRAPPVLEVDSEGGRHLLQGAYHVPKLLRENALHLLIGIIGLIVHVIIKSAQ